MPEAQLLGLIKEGDYDAFNEIYNRHSSSLYGAAYNVLRDKEACMDILQDIFAWFWEHRAQWQLTGCKGYLLTAVKFKTANYIRNNKFRNSFFQEIDVLQVAGDDKNSKIEVDQLIAFIKDITNELPLRCREIFELSRYKQLSNKEIASKLNISEKTVENQITIALKKLRGRLGNSYILFLLL